MIDEKIKKREKMVKTYKFIRKPEIVEAMKVTETTTHGDVEEFTYLFALRHLTVGEWLVKNKNGDVSVFSSDEFKASYRPMPISRTGKHKDIHNLKVGEEVRKELRYAKYIRNRLFTILKEHGKRFKTRTDGEELLVLRVE